MHAFIGMSKRISFLKEFKSLENNFFPRRIQEFGSSTIRAWIGESRSPSYELLTDYEVAQIYWCIYVAPCKCVFSSIPLFARKILDIYIKSINLNDTF